MTSFKWGCHVIWHHTEHPLFCSFFKTLFKHHFYVMFFCHTRSTLFFGKPHMQKQSVSIKELLGTSPPPTPISDMTIYMCAMCNVYDMLATKKLLWRQKTLLISWYYYVNKIYVGCSLCALVFCLSPFLSWARIFDRSSFTINLRWHLLSHWLTLRIFIALLHRSNWCKILQTSMHQL